MKEIVVGDVHGCLEQLVEILKISEFNKNVDRLIFVGDLIDRGPEIINTLKYVKDLKRSMGERLVYVIGNHEFMWSQRQMHYGGVGYKEFYEWIMSNVVYYYEGKNFNVVHGGPINGKIKNVRIDDLVWDRDAFERGLYNGKFTIIGHTPIYNPTISSTEGSRILQYYKIYDCDDYSGLLNIDTGCVFGGQLTSAVFVGNKFKLIKADNKNGNY